MTFIPKVLYRGEAAEWADFHRDGRTVFLTDQPEEALEYGPYLIEVRIDAERMFDPGNLAMRQSGDWNEADRLVSDMDLSERFLAMLVDRFGETRAEAIYHHVEGGSWSEVERPEVQEWLRSEGFDGFVCWEGNGMTYAVFDPDNVTVIARSQSEDADPTFP